MGFILQQSDMKIFMALMLISFTQKGYAQVSFESWLQNEVIISQSKIFASMSFQDLAPGAIVASPSKSQPDYYYHWIRDAGLVADVLVDMYQKSSDINRKKYLEQKIKNYISFSAKNQKAPALSGFGEPKFYVDGTAYSLPWGRPQNDGPALRALALVKWAEIRIDEGFLSEVQNQLYDGKIPTKTVIKNDLEYVAAHWSEASFDLWEEVLGDHFFTRWVQRSALLKGAQLAQKLGDLGASDWYLKQALQIEASLNSFVRNVSYSYIPSTLNIQGHDKSKKMNLDSAVLLGLLRAPSPDLFLPWSHIKVQKTLETLIQEFSQIYNINRGHLNPGVAVGRYPEDVYDGENSIQGNPWVLTTLAAAETYYEMAQAATEASQVQGLIDQGDAFFQRVRVHAFADGSLSEQIDRNTGYMRSAYDLTWNYAAVLTTYWARERALKNLIK